MMHFFKKLFSSSDRTEEVLGKMQKLKAGMRASMLVLKENIQYCKQNIQDLHLRIDKLERAKEDSTFSVETKTTYDPEKEDPVVTGVTLNQSCVEFFTDLVERQYKDDKLIQAQRRFTNRLLRLLRNATNTSSWEVAAEMQKIEKWNKVLKRRVSEHNRRSK